MSVAKILISVFRFSFFQKFLDACGRCGLTFQTFNIFHSFLCSLQGNYYIFDVKTHLQIFRNLPTVLLSEFNS